MTEIPKHLTGLPYYWRQMTVMANDIKGEVDMLFYQVGLDKYVPKTVRYVLVLAFFCSPLVVLVVLLCCCFDEEPPMPSQRVYVAPAATADKKELPAQKQPTREKIE